MHYRGSRRKIEREKGPEKIFEEIIAEKFLNIGKEIINPVQETQRVPDTINLVCVLEHTKTHSNQTDKNQRQR